MRVFSIYDAKGECWGDPKYFRTDGEAVRAVQQAMRDQSTMFYQYPEDYTLFCVGEWDPIEGELRGHQSNVPVVRLMALAVQAERAEGDAQ